MVKRSWLEVDVPYFDRSKQLYFYTPDGVGAYWFDTWHELMESLGYSGDAVLHIDRLED